MVDLSCFSNSRKEEQPKSSFYLRSKRESREGKGVDGGNIQQVVNCLNAITLLNSSPSLHYYKLEGEN